MTPAELEVGQTYLLDLVAHTYEGVECTTLHRFRAVYDKRTRYVEFYPQWQEWRKEETSIVVHLEPRVVL